MSKLQLFYSVLALVFQLGIHKSLALENYAEDPNWREGLPDYLVDGSSEKDKRHLAAMAKNGRLPMLSHFGGKRVSESDKNIMDTVDRAEKYLMSTKRNDTETKPPELTTEQKRYVGAFLRSRGRPVSAFRGSLEPRGWDSDDDNPDKRNIAALARMGRLREIKSWPYGAYREEEGDDNDCADEGEHKEEETNRIREKRYMAALARNGRLPPLRGFRPWWSDKRTKSQELFSWPPYRSTKSLTDKRIQKDIIKTTRCKKFAASNYLSDEDNELGMDLSNFQKRNVGLLARKGLLTNRPFVP